jgi:hypothetical protein
MRIYLDTNVFQDLKKSENRDLLKLFQADMKRNIYCFSEAHIYDLVRDATAEKLTDMTFIEGIVDNNCWRYDKKIIFDYETPLEYYRRFDWTPAKSIFTSDEDIFSVFARLTLSAIPLNFADLIAINELPPNFPETFKTLFTKNTTMFDFIQAFLDMTVELTSEQKEFKKMIQYLHEHSLTGKIYRGIKLEGFDGNNVTDKEAFKMSYEAFFLKNNDTGKYRYDLFLNLHSGLELFGIVKGKPKKQKMMNMINDGRHAFFGAFCDIVVSKDADMLNKTKFLYDLYDIRTKVMTINEFIQFQANREQHPDGIHAMLAELEHFESLETIHEEKDDHKVWISKRLTHAYLGVFDTLNYVITNTLSYSYFTKTPNNLSNGTLTKEIAYVTQQAVSAFGPDFGGKTEFSTDELTEGKWSGREWLFGDTGIHLKLDQKIYLSIFKGKVAENF